MDSNQKNVNEFANKLAEKTPIYEKILVVTAFVGLALKMSGIEFGAMIIIVSLLSLAMLSMIMAYTSPIKDATPFDSFMFKSQSMGSSVALVGILFLLLNWNGYSNMLTVGILTLIIPIVYNLYKNKNTSLVLKPIIIISIAIVLYFTPKETLHSLHIISNNLMVK